VNAWDALILGIVQGATEFLPVSSSGHLVVGQRLLGLQVPGIAVEVALHVGTLLSVVVVYRERLTKLAVGAVRGRREAWRYVGLLALATLPAAVVGLAFESGLEAMFDRAWVPGVGFLVTAALLLSVRGREGGRDAALDARVALLVGLAQAAALVPGVSRSGATVVAALWLGIEAREAAAFSFLLSVPAIAGAAVLLLAGDAAGAHAGVPAPVLLIGGAAAGLTGVAAIRLFVGLLARGGFHRFAYYLTPLGVGYLLYLWGSA